MAKRKKIRSKGKLKLSRYFSKMGDGERVSVIRELGIPATFPKRLQGTTGIILEGRGKFKVIKIKDGAKEKKFIIHPAHLRKL